MELFGRVKQERTGVLAKLPLQRHAGAAPAPAGHGGALPEGPPEIRNAPAGEVHDNLVEVFDVVGVAPANRQQVEGVIGPFEVTD